MSSDLLALEGGKRRANVIEQWSSCSCRCIPVGNITVDREEEEIRWTEYRLGYVEEGAGLANDDYMFLFYRLYCLEISLYFFKESRNKSQDSRFAPAYIIASG